tara:strand:- start:500 stop:1096 length:597 start_codon:yes stop_codon:yes gene_type:complete
MDMLNILKNMDAAAAGDKPSINAAATNNMKAILESFNQIEECGMPEMGMPQSMPSPDPVTMNVTLNARGSDAIADLIKLMGGASAPQHAPAPMPVKAMPPMPTDRHDDMKRLMSIAGDDDKGEEMSIAMDDMEEEHDGGFADATMEPDESYGDIDLMTKELSGGINREKPKGSERVKDPAVESIKAQLYAALQEKLSK